jgi:hypothetical protein
MDMTAYPAIKEEILRFRQPNSIFIDCHPYELASQVFFPCREDNAPNNMRLAASRKAERGRSRSSAARG